MYYLFHIFKERKVQNDEDQDEDEELLNLAQSDPKPLKRIRALIRRLGDTPKKSMYIES